MNVSRETVSEALLGLFTPLRRPAGSFVTVSRILEPFANIDPSKLPALYLVEDDENDDQQQTWGLETYKLDYVLWIYTPVLANNLTPPGTALNAALDAVDLAIRGQLGDLQQLDGIVNNCIINGRVIKQVGIVGQGMPSVARIPVQILTGA